MILRATKTDIEVIDLTKARASQFVATMKNKGYTIKSSTTHIKPRPRIFPVTSQTATVKSATRYRKTMIIIMVTTLFIAQAALGLAMVQQFGNDRQQGKVGKMMLVVRQENSTENESKYLIKERMKSLLTTFGLKLFSTYVFSARSCLKLSGLYVCDF